MSTSAIILYLITFYLTRTYDSPHVYFMSRIMLIGDIYTNFASILLSYTYFDQLYFKICGSCHNGCHSCWIHCSNKDSELTMKTIMSTTKSDIEATSTCMFDKKLSKLFAGMNPAEFFIIPAILCPRIC